MPGAKSPSPVRIPPALLAVGVLVVIFGFGLPSLVSQPKPDPALPAAPPGAEAFAPGGAPAPLQQAPGGLGLALVRLVVALAVVCGGCVLVVRWLGRKPPDAAAPAMAVLASLRVGRCAVHLVRAGDRRMLIGTDASGVKALLELPGPAPAPDPPADALPDALPARRSEAAPP